MATVIGLLLLTGTYPWYSTTRGAQQSPPLPGGSHLGSALYPSPLWVAGMVWDVQELPGFLSSYSFFKIPLKCPLCPACCMAESQKGAPGSLPGGRHCCSSGKQGLLSRYDPWVFSCFSILSFSSQMYFAVIYFWFTALNLGGKKRKNCMWLRESACCRSPVNPQPFPDGIKLFNRSRAMDNH